MVLGKQVSSEESKKRRGWGCTGSQLQIRVPHPPCFHGRCCFLRAGGRPLIGTPCSVLNRPPCDLIYARIFPGFRNLLPVKESV